MLAVQDAEKWMFGLLFDSVGLYGDLASSDADAVAESAKLFGITDDTQQMEAGFCQTIEQGRLGFVARCVGTRDYDDDDESAAGQLLLDAVRWRYLRVANAMILREGIDVETADSKGWTPLFIAVRDGQLELTHALLNKQAKATATDHDGRTVLHHVRTDNDGLVTALLAHGADPRIEDRYGNTALHLAAFRGLTAVVQALLDGGLQGKADPHAVNKQRFTPLHYAALQGRRACVKALLEAGADPQAAGVCGITPRHAVRGVQDIHAMLWDASERQLKGVRRWLHTAKFRLRIGTKVPLPAAVYTGQLQPNVASAVGAANEAGHMGPA